MNSALRSAHCISLYLFEWFRDALEMSVEDAETFLREHLAQVNLAEHVQLKKVVNGVTTLSFESLSPYGDTVLEEFRARSEFPPCPKGECEYDGSRECKWCGHRECLQ